MDISSPFVTPVHVESPPLNVDGSTNTADHPIVEHLQTNSTDKMANASSTSVTHESTVKRSSLAELVNIPRINRDNRLKTGHARVLTSSECIKAFEEKERKGSVQQKKKNRKEKLSGNLKKDKERRKYNARRRRRLKRQQQRKLSNVKSQQCRQVSSRASS